jgi:hypothetical protein
VRFGTPPDSACYNKISCDPAHLATIYQVLDWTLIEVLIRLVLLDQYSLLAVAISIPIVYICNCLGHAQPPVPGGIALVRLSIYAARPTADSRKSACPLLTHPLVIPLQYRISGLAQPLIDPFGVDIEAGVQLASNFEYTVLQLAVELQSSSGEAQRCC